MPLLVKHSLREALRGIRRSGWASGASIATIAASFLVIGAFLLVSYNLSLLISRWSREVQLTVFLKEGLRSGQVSSLREQISKEEAVRSLSYISKEQALLEFKRDMRNQEGLLEGLGYNPLPASFQIQVRERFQSPEQLQELAHRLRQLPGVEDVLYGQEWIERLSLIRKLLRWGGFSLGGLLLFASILIVANTIRLAICRFEEEIGLMRLAGATWGVIRTPFVFQGILQGLIGSALSLLVLFLSFRLIQWQLHLLPSAVGYEGPQFLRISHQALALLAGGLIGGGGGLLSVRRFLGP